MRMLKAIVFCVFLSGFPGVAAAQPRIVLVPFGDVSAVSGKMPSPTSFLSEQLAAAHVDVADAGPVDPIFAATDASNLCAHQSAGGVLIGVLELTRTSKMEAPIGIVGIFTRSASAFTQDAVGVTTGLIPVSGLLSRTAIRAQVKLYLVGCTGKLQWTGMAVAGETHDGNNIGAGYTQIVQRAIREAVEKLRPELLAQ